MSNIKAIKETIEQFNDAALFIDGMDEALIGMVGQFDRFMACYSASKIIDILIEMGMTQEEAIEFFDFNIIGAWMGEYTPVVVFDHLS